MAGDVVAEFESPELSMEGSDWPSSMSVLVECSRMVEDWYWCVESWWKITLFTPDGYDGLWCDRDDGRPPMQMMLLPRVGKADA